MGWVWRGVGLGILQFGLVVVVVGGFVGGGFVDVFLLKIII